MVSYRIGVQSLQNIFCSYFAHIKAKTLYQTVLRKKKKRFCFISETGHGHLSDGYNTSVHSFNHFLQI